MNWTTSAKLSRLRTSMWNSRPISRIPRQSFYEAIHELHEEILNNRFDQTIGMTFLNRLMTSQVGSEVVLSDDRVGKIMFINANYPACPIVAVGSEWFDLSQNQNLKIMEIVG